MTRKFRWGCITVLICLYLTFLGYFLIISGIDFLATNQEPTIESEFPLRQVWRVDLDGQIDHPLARWEDKIFVRTSKSLYALRGEDGSVVWQLRNLRNMSQEVIFAKAGWVVIRQTPESIIVVEAETGSIRIAIPDTYPTRSIDGGTLDEQSLYLILNRGLHVYDLKSGVERWGGRQGDGLDVFTNSRGENFYLIGSKFIGIINRTSGEGESHIRFVDKLESHPYPNVYAAARDE
ncbi:MAG: PQQ-binding-like beta-propeller repeat protein, partial [Deltaproteobacteria bacterium]|nr:PQQ-binding-like beta-propeller repeat protein [Deltaproteobacteria bacterium]